MIDLVGNKKVLPSVAAKYVAFLRKTAYERSGRDDVYKRFFVFDACFFERAGPEGSLTQLAGCTSRRTVPMPLERMELLARSRSAGAERFLSLI